MSQDEVTANIARRMKAFRAIRGLTAEALAEKMAERNVPFPASVVSNLEIGRRRYVTVTELLALASVLRVHPMNLLGSDALEVTTTHVVT